MRRSSAGLAAWMTHARSLNAALRFPNISQSSSNRVGCKVLLRCRCREHGRLRGRQVSPHDGASRATLPRFITHSWHEPWVQRMARNGSAYVPAGRLARLATLTSWVDQAVVGAPRNGSPVVSMLCMMTASLRATATAARLKPSRSRSCSPHLRRSHSDRLRVRSTVAAS